MKISCNCGNTIFDQTDDLPNKAHLVPDEGWCTMWDAIEDQVINAVASGMIKSDDASWKARLIVRSAGKRLMWQCNSCGRLYIDDRSGNLQCFLPATSETDKQILRAHDCEE